MNSTICKMLKTLTDKERTTWNDHMNKHSSAGYFSYQLLFGYKPRLPKGLILDQIPKVNHVTSYDQEAMGQAYDMAASKSEETKQKDKNRRNIGACLDALQTGDRVLVRNCRERGGKWREVEGSRDVTGKMILIT